MQAIKEPIPQPCELIAFPKQMATPAPDSPKRTRKKSPFYRRDAATAAWLAFGLALVLAIVAGIVYIADEHLKNLIGETIKAPLKDVKDDISRRLDQADHNAVELQGRVAKLEGQFLQLEADQKGLRASQTHTNKRLDQQAALAKVIDTSTALALMRENVESAIQNKKTIPTERLITFRSAVQAIPSSAYEYWQTVAAIINYQSLINQMSGKAPDPAKVSRPCNGMTTQQGMLSQNNLFVGFPIRNCVVDLDTLHFVGDTFINSVIRYHGGPTTLSNVTFINCYFDVEIPANSKPAEQPARAILFSLLNSGDQSRLTVSTHS